MTYMLLILIILFSVITLAAKHFSACFSSKEERRRVLLVPILLIASLMALTSIMGPIFGILFFDASDSTITSLPFNTHLFVTISLIGCVILTITSLWGYYKKFRVPAMFCAITSLIAGASAADYLHFTYNRAMAGNVNFDIFRDMVTDVNCTTGMMIIQWDEKETTPISYRCATSRTFGFMGSQPVFIPWPDYQSGTSMKLSQALSMALKEAKMHTESSKSESKKTN